MDEFAELGQLDGFEGNSCEERAPFEHYSAPLRRLSGHNNRGTTTLTATNPNHNTTTHGSIRRARFRVLDHFSGT
jgi:hypothetical protein